MKDQFDSYFLAKTWKRIISRFMDIVLVSIWPGIASSIIYAINQKLINQWWVILIILFFNVLVIFIWFVIIPWIWDGKTVGKRVFRIKLVDENNKRVKFKTLMYREFYLVFLPSLITTLTIVGVYIFSGQKVDPNNPLQNNVWLNILFRSAFSFVFGWYLGIMIITKIDKKHQLFYDRHYNIYVISDQKRTDNLVQKQKQEMIKILKNEPGNIADEELDNIQNL